MTLTMNSRLPKHLKLPVDNVLAIKDLDQAKDCLGLLFGSEYWESRWKRAGHKVKLKHITKVKRLIKKIIPNLPNRTDEYGNIMETFYCADLDDFFVLSDASGATKTMYNNGLCAASIGPGIGFTYCEGSAIQFTGDNVGKAITDSVNFWIND